MSENQSAYPQNLVTEKATGIGLTSSRMRISKDVVSKEASPGRK